LKRTIRVKIIANEDFESAITAFVVGAVAYEYVVCAEAQ
jgi:hypothetical protein